MCVRVCVESACVCVYVGVVSACVCVCVCVCVVSACVCVCVCVCVRVCVHVGVGLLYACGWVGVFVWVGGVPIRQSGNSPKRQFTEAAIH